MKLDGVYQILKGEIRMLIHAWCNQRHLTLDIAYPNIGEVIHVDFGRGFVIVIKS
jgi:hypothetical protein